ncbi:MAG: MFS transporter [Chloroflexi bacterium]|nr:MFS transporter [Chloroflexota bacterium]MCI0575671.1 MFS transporter [Chloroflexota bacterium]MCI0647526.1 MFS transporter [Chloroflexota bacterium]MCI0730837.1 MFS transporter [Chloroflexota bacterium]
MKRWQLVLYASGSLATALSYQAFSTYIQFLYIDTLGLRAAWVGNVWSLYGLWNAVNDPLAGYWSDKTHTRWGRRIPWIAGAFIPLAITFYLLWVPPAGLRDAPLLVYFLVFVLAFDFLWTIVVMNWTALFPEMVPDERQRASVSAWRQLFSLVGLLVGVALPPILAGEDWSGRGGMALLFAVVTAVFFGLSLLGSRERPEFRHDEALPLRAALRTTFANRDFLFFLGMNLMVQFVFLALTATVPFYAKYVLRIQSETAVPALGLTLDVGLQNSLLLAVPFLVALPAMFLWTALAHRFGAWQTMRLACLTAAASLLLLFWPDSFWTGLLATTIFGLPLAGLLMLTDLLIAAVIDADELATGARREGLYFGMNGLAIRFAFTMQGMMTGNILALTGYVAPTPAVLYPAQPAAVLAGMRWMVAGIPALAMLLALALLQGYRLHGKRLVAMQQEVAALHAQKHQALVGDSRPVLD